MILSSAYDPGRSVTVPDDENRKTSSTWGDYRPCLPLAHRSHGSLAISFAVSTLAWTKFFSLHQPLQQPHRQHHRPDIRDIGRKLL